MSILWHSFKAGLTSSISSLILLNGTQVNATPVLTTPDYSYSTPSNIIHNEFDQIGQITPVSQLADVSVDSWAFQALQTLTEQYGCVSGFSDGTYRGNQSLTRYEFAAGLSACIDFINEQIANSQSATIDQETLTALQRLQAEFSTELATLRGQVDGLEARVATLEAQQFSPHVELEGEIIFALAGFAGDERADGSGEAIDENLVLSDRVRLSFISSFTGEDELQVRLQARNTPELEDVTGTQMANLGFDGDNGNDVELDEIEYEFPLGDQTSVTLFGLGGGLGDFVPSVNPLFSGSGDGSISTFGRENPIRRQGGGAGIGISHDLTETMNVSLGYITDDATNPETGIFASPYGAIAQFTLEPTESTEFSLTYIHSYNNLGTGTGSELTADPFNDEADAVIADSFGAEAAWQLSPNITLGGRVGLIHAYAEDLPDTPDADIWTWAILLALTELGQEDSFAGLVIGQPPKVVSNSFGSEFEDDDTSLHLEAFYYFQITDNLAITPGLFVITSPEHNNDNDPLYIGTIRTTFTF